MHRTASWRAPAPSLAILSEARGGDSFGPGGVFELRGPAVKVETTRAARDEGDARRLWKVSETLTGVSFVHQEVAPP